MRSWLVILRVHILAELISSIAWFTKYWKTKKQSKSCGYGLTMSKGNGKLDVGAYSGHLRELLPGSPSRIEPPRLTTAHQKASAKRFRCLPDPL